MIIRSVLFTNCDYNNYIISFIRYKNLIETELNCLRPFYQTESDI